MDKLTECIEYFRSRPVYQKVFSRVREKMVGLGRLGGSIKLSGLSREEKEQLEGFFQKGFRSQESITISAALMEKSLENSRFCGLDWQEILESYFGQELISRQEVKRREEKEKERFFVPFYTDAWMTKMLRRHGLAYTQVMKLYGEDKAKLGEYLRMVQAAVKRLPVIEKTYISLPVFAAEITGNPHYFDEGTAAGLLLQAYLCERFGAASEGLLSPPEKKSRILYQGGILKDDLSNFTMAYGIHARRENGEIHQGIEGFFQEKEPVQCTLLTLGGLAEVWGKPTVYAVENPAVFSVLICRNPEISIVCTNGQPRLASLVLLDLLAKHSRIKYAGDFDPEGLSIAWRLKQRYPEQLEYWDYRPEYYLRAMSEVALSEPRLKKLDRIQDDDLTPIVQEMKKEKRAAYQEAMIGFAYTV